MEGGRAVERLCERAWPELGISGWPSDHGWDGCGVEEHLTLAIRPPRPTMRPPSPLHPESSDKLASHVLALSDALLFAGAATQPTGQQLKTSHRALAGIKAFLVGATLGLGASRHSGLAFIALQARPELNGPSRRVCFPAVRC